MTITLIFTVSPRYSINSFSNSYRMWRLFLSHLNEARLKQSMLMQLLQSDLIIRRHTSVAHPLFAECVQGLSPPQLVHATISLGPLASFFFSFYS